MENVYTHYIYVHAYIHLSVQHTHKKTQLFLIQLQLQSTVEPSDYHNVFVLWYVINHTIHDHCNPEENAVFSWFYLL